MNVLYLQIDQMLGPLLLWNPNPPLFLAIERISMLVLGEGLYALRLPSLLASCLAVILLADLSKRVIGVWQSMIAVILFSFSDRILWHACEARSYSFDVLVAVAASWWFVRTMDRSLWACCLPAAIIAPFAIWVSFPACFVAGGLLLALFPSFVAREARMRDRISYLILTLLIMGSFAALALGPVAAQKCDTLDDYWVSQFPNWSRPWSVPLWAIVSTFEVGRYCVLPLGQGVFLFAMIGAYSQSKNRNWRFVICVASPIALAMVASLLHRYPYGGTRLEVFAAPAICLLAGAGLASLLKRYQSRQWLCAIITLLLIAPPVGLTMLRVVKTWHRAESDKASEYVIQEMTEHDIVLHNHWDYDYYFFKHAKQCRYWMGEFKNSDLSTQGRIWIIHTDTAHQTSQFPQTLIPPGWQVVETREFLSTHVFRLERIPCHSE